MNARTIAYFLLSVGFIVSSHDLSAQRPKDFIWRYCWFEYAKLDPEVFKIRVPVGCEVIDCCPGCPGPPIDWRIKVQGEAPIRPTLNFENMPGNGLQNLDMDADMKQSGGTLKNGTTTIRGFKPVKGQRPPVGVLQFLADTNTLARMAEQKKYTGESSFEVEIEQDNGSIAVSRYAGVIIIRWDCLPPRLPSDKVDLDANTLGDDAVVLVDGRNGSGTCIDDAMFRGSNLVNVGSLLTIGSCRSEVSVFSDDNAMEFFPNVNIWTDPLGDVLPSALHPLLHVPVRVWLRMGDAATLARAQADIANANLLFNTNHAGVQFDATFTNVSNNAQAAAVITNTFSCLPAENTALTGSAFFAANTINVYYIDVAFTGFNCTAVRNIIFVGTTSNNQSLAHEIGHSFSLGHTNTVAGIPATNVMIGGGAGRTNFTEGQDFRMNLNPTSTLNTNGVRTGPTRTCADATTSAACPALTLNAIPK
jgi:hypothetical protein